MTIRVITLTGEVATGKSTIANALLAKLPGWEKANTGAKFREICQARGMSIQEVSFLPDDIHREVDTWQRDIARTGSNLIIEGRLAGWLTKDMPHVFRVFCTTDQDVRIARYIQREQTSEADAKAAIEFRDSRDVQKYQRMYNLPDYRDLAFYSLVLDTSSNTPEELAERILERAGLVSHAPSRG